MAAENTGLTKEEAAAWRLAALAANGTANEFAKFSGWLMTGFGAVLAFFVANHASVTGIIGITYIRVSLFLFAASMLFGLLAQWLSVPVKAGLAFSLEALRLRTQELNPPAFVHAFSSLLIFPYRCLFTCRLDSAKNIDALSPIRSPARLSQYQALSVIFQCLCAVAVVLTLAFGVKV